MPLRGKTDLSILVVWIALFLAEVPFSKQLIDDPNCAGNTIRQSDPCPDTGANAWTFVDSVGCLDYWWYKELNYAECDNQCKRDTRQYDSGTTAGTGSSGGSLVLPDNHYEWERIWNFAKNAFLSLIHI